jgi:hypothetical protein
LELEFNPLPRRRSGYADTKEVDQPSPEKRQEGQSRSHAVVREVYDGNEASRNEVGGRIEPEALYELR